jgi:UDP-N-acetylmuramoyl-L-alanyl-D-glutamate--2,6-diaminopimelate ligase
MEAYGAAKSLLFRREGVEFAVINFDDPFGQQINEQLSGETDRIRYSLHEPQTELWLTRFVPHAGGFEAEVDGKWGRFSFGAPLLGRFNASNVLAAIAAALSLGLPVDSLVSATERLLAPPGRLESFASATGIRVVVDYAHTPDALSNALEALKPHTDGMLWCVFGCGGDRDTAKRPLMAREAEQLADCIVVTDDTPRYEDPRLIVEQIMGGFEQPERVRITHDRGAAIRLAVMEASSGDVVLVAGKGHETYQEIRGERYEFSDAGAVRQALADREAAA